VSKLRKYSRIAAVIALFLVVPTGYLTIRSANGDASARAFLADPMSVFSDRSPGQRGIGDLGTTKPSYAMVSPVAAGPAGPDPEVALPDLEGFSEAPIPGISESPFLTPQPFGDEASFAPSGSFDPFGSGGPMGGVFPPLLSPPPGAPPVRPPAVPEPDTWLMMITGFLAIGSALRSRKKRRTEAPRKAALAAAREKRL
jgi:hypothetical protein